MIDTMGIIIASDINIPPLTDFRSASALPIAGGYRIIDFVLSGMANAGIKNVGVATKANYSSLMDHIKSGSPWDLKRKKRGLNILPPNIGNKNYFETIRGDLDILYGIKEYIRRSQETYVILSLGNSIYNIDFKKIVKTHIKNQADVTIIYKDMKNIDQKELSRYTLLELDAEHNVTDIEVRPYYPKSTNASMDLFVMEKALLESIRYVDLVVPEENWEQKINDMEKYQIDTFVMGSDWEGKFDYLQNQNVDVIYLPRTPEISSEIIRNSLKKD